MKDKKVTFADVARATNFSKTTISRYFNNPDSLTPENRKIIEKALEDMGYRENKVARILANGHTEFIGILVPNLYMHYYAEILHQLLRTYETYGYKFLVFEEASDFEQEKRYVEELLSYNVEGMVVLSHGLSSRQLASYGVPVVAIEREDKYVSSVNTDNLMGGVQATSVLYKCSCDSFFFIDSAPTHITPSADRRRGFSIACAEKNIKGEILLQEMGSDYQANYRAISAIIDDIALRHPGERKGIFCGNDTYAEMVLIHLVRSYSVFPDDFRLIGFDGSPVSENALIPFSTIGQQIDVIAAKAMELLHEQILARHRRIPEKVPVRHEVITPVVICRDTSLPEPSGSVRTQRSYSRHTMPAPEAHTFTVTTFS